MNKPGYAIGLLLLLFYTTATAGDGTRVLLRSDDFGMSHAVNLALEQMIGTGIPFNASVMMVTPWVPEAARMLADAPQVSAGLHLTLTSEFEQLKWGPISGRSVVPSLVDDRGYFHSSVRDFLLSDYRLDQVEIELRAQIERALAMGMQVDYLDHHMGIARSTPEIAAVVEKLAAEYGFVIARYFDEYVAADIWGTPIEGKVEEVMTNLGALEPGRVNLFVFHTAMDNPEIADLDDRNTLLMSDPDTGKSILGKHRSTELRLFLSKEFRQALKDKTIVTYGDLRDTHGEQMQRGGILYESMEQARTELLAAP